MNTLYFVLVLKCIFRVLTYSYHHWSDLYQQHCDRCCITYRR